MTESSLLEIFRKMVMILNQGPFSQKYIQGNEIDPMNSAQP